VGRIMKKPKPKSKTEKEIQAEIALLKDIKPFVRHFSGFGGDNHKLLEIQIRVLEEDFDDNDVNHIYEDVDENSIAYETVQWRDGTDEDIESPIEGWKLLAPNWKSK
jgi:hypothetical protein